MEFLSVKFTPGKNPERSYVFMYTYIHIYIYTYIYIYVYVRFSAVILAHRQAPWEGVPAAADEGVREGAWEGCLAFANLGLPGSAIRGACWARHKIFLHKFVTDIVSEVQQPANAAKVRFWKQHFPDT